MAGENQPITKKDLDAAQAELREWIAERMEAMETRLLTAFHRYTEASELRLQRVETEQRIDFERLTKLEERVRALEERLDFPGHQRPQ